MQKKETSFLATNKPDSQLVTKNIWIYKPKSQYPTLHSLDVHLQTSKPTCTTTYMCIKMLLPNLRN